MSANDTGRGPVLWPGLAILLGVLTTPVGWAISITAETTSCTGEQGVASFDSGRIFRLSRPDAVFEDRRSAPAPTGTDGNATTLQQAAPPAIRLVDPPVLAAPRSSTRISTAPDASSRQIVDNVRADAGLFSLTVNGMRQTPNDDGLFPSAVPIESERINKGVYELVKQIGSTPAHGAVVQSENGQVWINLGDGLVEVGDRLVVEREGEAQIDPDTGLNLGTSSAPVGEVEVVQVEEKFSIASIVRSSAEPARGDRVISTMPRRAWSMPAASRRPEPSVEDGVVRFR